MVNGWAGNWIKLFFETVTKHESLNEDMHLVEITKQVYHFVHVPVSMLKTSMVQKEWGNRPKRKGHCPKRMRSLSEKKSVEVQIGNSMLSTRVLKLIGCFFKFRYQPLGRS
jgi:hypothetical protein